MRAAKWHHMIWLGLLTGAILACNAIGNAATVIAPTTAGPTATSAAEEPPTGTVSPPTEVPPTAAPLEGTPIAHMAAGQAIDIGYIHMLDANQGWGIGGVAQAQDHVFRTQDSGQTWSDVTPPEPVPSDGSALAALGFFADASHAWVIFSAAQIGPVPDQARVWSSADGGASWTYGAVDTSAASAEFFGPLYMDFPDSQHGWLLVGVGAGMNHAYVVLYSTQDAGKTWTAIVAPGSDVDIQSFSKTGMVFVDAQTGWLTRDAQGVDMSPHIFITQDGGVSWTRIDLPAPAGASGYFDNNACGTYSPLPLASKSVLVLLQCVDASTFKVEHDYLYSTADAGQTWQAMALPSNFEAASSGDGALFFPSAQSGLVLGRVIYRTDDGGKTWSKGKQVNWDGQFSFVDMNTGWAVARNAGQIALVKTADGGKTWTEVHPVVGQ